MGTVSPKVQAVEYGGVIYINCYSNYKIEWMFKQPKWHKRAIKSRYTISISPAIYSDTGNYSCVGSYRSWDKIIPFTDTAYVYVGRKL